MVHQKDFLHGVVYKLSYYGGKIERNPLLVPAFSNKFR
jgi:hypothetical protein